MIPDHENFKLELRYTEGYWCYEGEVKFRLEKVSLRCDGKKFKLSIAVDVGADKIREMESDAVQAGSKAGALAPWIREISRAGGCEVSGWKHVRRHGPPTNPTNPRTKSPTFPPTFPPTLPPTFLPTFLPHLRARPWA